METASENRTKTNTKIQTKTAPKVVFVWQGLGVAGVQSCVLYVGGNSNNTTNDGAGYVNVNNGLTNTNTNNGSRLATKFLIFRHFETESPSQLHLSVGELTVALCGTVECVLSQSPAHKSPVAHGVTRTSDRGCLTGMGELMHTLKSCYGGVPRKEFTSI